ncbi:MAG: AEC family transporter [Sneathiella sp.]
MEISALLVGIVPVFSIILIGYFLKRLVLSDDKQWAGMERITFVLLIPCLIIKTLVEANLSQISIQSIATTLLGALCLVLLILSVVYFLLVKNNRISVSAFTSIFQTATRWNAFIALAINESLFDNIAVSLTAVCMVILMPIINIINVSVLTSLLTNGSVSLIGLIGKILKNPIIVACLIGVAISLSSIQPWAPAMDILGILGKTSLGLILLSVGAGLKLAAFSNSKKNLFLSCSLKLFMMPALVVLLGIIVGLDELTLTTVTLIAAMPSASNGYILAREMGGDAPLYANAVSLQVLLSFVTIPMWLRILSELQGIA